VLEDPKQAFPPYDAVLLVGPTAAHRPAVMAALRPLVSRVGDELMRRANMIVDVDKRSIADAAALIFSEIDTAPGH